MALSALPVEGRVASEGSTDAEEDGAIMHEAGVAFGVGDSDAARAGFDEVLGSGRGGRRPEREAERAHHSKGDPTTPQPG